MPEKEITDDFREEILFSMENGKLVSIRFTGIDGGEIVVTSLYEPAN